VPDEALVAIATMRVLVLASSVAVASSLSDEQAEVRLAFIDPMRRTDMEGDAGPGAACRRLDKTAAHRGLAEQGRPCPPLAGQAALSPRLA
jgi:hypothetical protein